MEKTNLFSHILVPTDGSDTSTRAGIVASELAQIHESSITFIYVVDSATVNEIADTMSRSTDAIRRELETKGQHYLDYLSRIAEDKGLTADQVISFGIPHDEIAEAARRRSADLIVIGRVGCRGPRCVLIGSVAERVLERAPCPVLVVGQGPNRR